MLDHLLKDDEMESLAVEISVYGHLTTTKHTIHFTNLPPLPMPPIIPSIISQKLLLRHSVALRLPAALLTIRRDTRPRSLPNLALARLSNTARTIAMPFVGERPTRSARLLLLSLLAVNVVQAVHAALVVLAADVEVEAEGGHG